ncbi:ATP-grasp domain-containing protein [Streptomyces antibioticus]|uniref:Alpha-L-glutamate ligase n=1 Tax=Streptomyces antibioticus TaxID=1890 RepID=A0AAE7CJN7_STRAT|nr:alpha-L-glutamate ligase [Streptomyces antibioticus]OOQ55071.1 alpha-L-glutamate ligase [Streptomyces antibioticus]QIT42713.1 alpha-L-glutamate ligase [Streptomyces antibioticus]
MSRPNIALIADPSSPEGCREYLAEAVELLTGAPPVRVDSRHFATGGSGRCAPDGGRLRLQVPEERLDFVPDVVLLYEIPPHRRRDLAAFQELLESHDVVTLAAGPEAWRTATEKNLTVARFERDGVAQMETVVLSDPALAEAAEAFERLGGDTWARPVVGTGGDDTFHVTTPGQLAEATAYYAGHGTDWMLSRDAGNVTPDGLRHQFRVFVLGEQVVHAREHLQPEPDTPCNTCRGATPVHIDPADLPPRLAELAVAATASVGLPFAGVDLAPENGGVVFEVNVQPAFVDGAVEVAKVAVPYVQAHLDAFDLAGGGSPRGLTASA